MTTIASTPRGACDCHVHIYADGYPLAASATFNAEREAILVHNAAEAYGFDRMARLAGR